MKKIILCLTLVFVAASNSYALPGNYQQTCHRCEISARGNLSCRCLNANQYPQWTVLRDARRCNYIQNLNGQLACTSMKRRHHDRHNRRPDRNPDSPQQIHKDVNNGNWSPSQMLNG